MNHRLAFLFAACSISARSASGQPADWKFTQTFQVTAPGLVKVLLPIETLGAARAGLEDLRLHDAAGKETPYLVQESIPERKKILGAVSLQVQLLPPSTILTFSTGTRRPIEGIELATPADNFIKSISADHSEDGAAWQPLGRGLPIFRQAGSGASKLLLAFEPGIRPFIRLIVDDGQSPPIPFTGVRIYESAAEPPSEPLTVTVAERVDSAGLSRFVLNLGAAHLRIARIQVEAKDVLFTRQATVAARRVEENEIREASLSTSTIYRLKAEGLLIGEDLRVPVEAQFPTGEMILLISNQDSPPLSISGFKALRRPVYIIFNVPQIGDYRLVLGNDLCAPPHYDLASMAQSLQSASELAVRFSPLAPNPSYKPAEPLSGVEVSGARIDASAWMHGRAIGAVDPGIYQFELDLETLSGAERDLRDLRIVRNGVQVPYILERTAIVRSFEPNFEAAGDAARPKSSRWSIRLPHAALPILRMAVHPKSRLFKRTLVLSEEGAGEHGGGSGLRSLRRGRNEAAVVLASGSWEQTPDAPPRILVLRLGTPPAGDRLFLETDNGDNPPLEIDRIECLYLASRVIFKQTVKEAAVLVYGNPAAETPRYDLSLAAGQLLAAERKPLELGPPAAPPAGGMAFGPSMSWLMWAILGLVAVVLLAIIARFSK